MPGVAVGIEAANSADARRCLAAYYAELQARFDAGFDPKAGNNFDPAEMTPPKGWFVVARDEGRAVGCGALKRLEPEVGEVKRVWIDAAMRGQGLARAIMERLEAIARHEHMAVLRLDTNRSLTEAHALYRKLGYREIAAYNDNPYAHHWFEKRL